MPFVLSRTSNVGTSHPTVARLMLQTSDILDAAGLRQEQKDELNTIFYKELQPVLLECWNIRDSLAKEVAECLEVCEVDLRDSRIVRLQSVNQLEQRAENFLYQAKNYLRNTLRVWNWFHGTEFADASAYIPVKKETQSKLEQWAVEAFGADDPRTMLIQSKQKWAAPVIRMRNALEHPGGFSGKVYFENITMKGNEVHVPTWCRNDEEPTAMIGCMTSLVEDMLAMGEDILAVNIEPRLRPMFGLYEIPVENRDPQQPARLRVRPTPEFMAKMRESSRGNPPHA
ncbi:hypothetical protein [Brevundimonas sp. SGAir0440]|uniref:hypothetical protein n=1 Tax=Brevundimonas sp. SGAir0440 TaxID=2579977 RepID=UPI0010CCE12B|nr:hypothetical protein [Brevundimonas sp. SGAir0440]QCQ98513.1 hypothetical protein E7T10_07455 [Brevundimonas sp. SGAir0440]